MNPLCFLNQVNISSCIFHWTWIFLWDRWQWVKVNHLSSPPLTLSTGAPQDWDLSPWLFSLNTNTFTKTRSCVFESQLIVDAAAPPAVQTNKLPAEVKSALHLVLTQRSNNKLLRAEGEFTHCSCSGNNRMLIQSLHLHSSSFFGQTAASFNFVLTLTELCCVSGGKWPQLNHHISFTFSPAALIDSLESKHTGNTSFTLWRQRNFIQNRLCWHVQSVNPAEGFWFSLSLLHQFINKALLYNSQSLILFLSNI